MSALRNMLLLAAASGILVAIAMTILQFFATVPLILQAETYETATPAVAAEADHHHHDHAAAAVEEHHHGGDEWQPADGFQRMGLTAVANVVTAIGFGLLLVAASEFAGGIRSWREGFLWGLAGFAVFTLAPGLGLPPELPGMPAAELTPRQIWWVGTVAATAGGLALIVWGRGPGLAFLGLAVLVVPHLIGAPQPASHESLVPEDLHHRFVVAVTVTNLVFWPLLGYAVAVLRPRFAAELGAPQPRLA
ncbi:cobalt transporter subunit CbtA [Amaricoccus macauensis]|uniref:Cobalt transporter subunit CbtA n=1 Tax=Amaricoccus macauensis TaxID=57001 RepID=A0A840SPT0_9RHOB|nr:CbtA family protein [Amaricoccus macauensis]MBB5224037.1 cobalt transporter subunit CbtA [Amaricoccus macauensis]